MRKILCILLVAIMFLQPLSTVFALNSEETANIDDSSSLSSENASNTETAPTETETSEDTAVPPLGDNSEFPEILGTENDDVSNFPETLEDEQLENNETDDIEKKNLELFSIPPSYIANTFLIFNDNTGEWEKTTTPTFFSEVCFVPNFDDYGYTSSEIYNSNISFNSTNSDDFKFSVERVKYGMGVYVWALLIEPGDIGISGKVLDGTVTITTATGTEILSHTFNNIEFQLLRVDSSLQVSSSQPVVIDPPELGLSGTQQIKLGSKATFSVNLSGQAPVEVSWNTRFDSDIAAIYNTTNLEFFNGNYAAFSNKGTLRINADAGSYIYQMDKNNKLNITPLSATYNKSGGYFEFKTNVVGRYIISDAPLKIVSIPLNERVAGLDTNFYCLNEVGVVDVATKNLPYSLEENLIYFPLLKADGKLVSNELAANYITAEIENANQWLNDPYFEINVVSKITNINGKNETAYFLELVYATELPQDDYSINVQLERNANDNLNFSPIVATLNFKAGYCIFNITTTPQEIDFTAYTGPVKIALDNTGYEIYADVTEDKKITLSYNITTPSEIEALFPSWASMEYIEIKSDKAFTAPADLNIYSSISSSSQMVYKLDESNNLFYLPVYTTKTRCVPITADKFGRYVITYASPLPATNPSPERVDHTSDKLFLLDSNGKVANSHSQDFVPGQTVYLPLLTENNTVVSLPEAVEDLKITFDYYKAPSTLTPVIVKKDYNISGISGEGYFIEFTFSNQISFSADYKFFMCLTKHSGQDSSGKSLKTMFTTSNFDCTVSHPISLDWVVTSNYQIFKFPNSTSYDATFTFSEFTGSFKVATSAYKKATLKADKLENSTVKSNYPSANLDFFNIYLITNTTSTGGVIDYDGIFGGTVNPTISGAFNRSGTLTLKATNAKYLYLVNSDNTLTHVASSNNGTFTIKTRYLGNYVASNIALHTTSGSGSTGGGGGGGGGSKGNSSSAASTATEIVFKPATTENALAAVAEGISNAKKSNNTTAYARLLNTSTLTLEQIKTMRAASDRTLRINGDSISITGKGVEVRVAFLAASATKDVDLSASTTSARAKQTSAFFAKWFTNKFATISMGHQGEFGMQVNIAAQIDLSNMDTTNLYFYSYDLKTNRYNRIFNPGYSIDSAGYLWFNTTFGGEVVVSDGPLELK